MYNFILGRETPQIDYHYLFIYISRPIAYH